MPHRLWIDGERAAMMYVGEDPWHGLGTKLAEPATAEQAIVAAKLDWQVKKIPLYAWADPVAYPIEGKYTVVPEDRWGKQDCPTFGIVSGSYRPLQNREAFEFFDPIVGEGAAVYHTAGALDEGQRIWLLAKLPDDIVVADDDITNKYLLLSNCHDGTGSVQIKFTPVRVVCHNTLTIAFKDRGRTVRVPHTRNMKERLKTAQENMQIIQTGFKDVEEAFGRMLAVKMDDKRLVAYLKLVFPDPATKKHDQAAFDKVERNRKRAERLFTNGIGNTKPRVAGTLWAAYNGVTEMVDHDRGQRTADQHLQHIWFGSGFSCKLRAYQAAQRLLQDLQDAKVS